MALTPQHRSALETHLDKLESGIRGEVEGLVEKYVEEGIWDKILAEIEAIKNKLVASDRLLAELIHHYQIQKNKNPTKLPPPPNTNGVEGSMEFGPVLYFLHYETDKIHIDNKLVRLLVFAFELHLPKTEITETMWKDFIEGAESTGVVGGDGTLYGTRQYEQLDIRWLDSLFHYVYTRSPLGGLACWDPTPPTISITGPDSDHVTLALLGDWGTGEFPDGTAIDIMNQATRDTNPDDTPDYTIHLGDVYYAGTTPDEFLDPNEERNNFIKYWRGGVKGTFTLNSNHEMYSGAKGYFSDALGAEIFHAQNNTSYFALTFKNWLILGLDSAYWSQSELYMYGALYDSSPESRSQLDFIQGIPGIADRHIIVLTHHTGLDYTGMHKYALWHQVKKAIGRDPDFWYWGHTHNAIVYSKDSAATDPETKFETKARCVGHGAIPFGAAWGLMQTDGDGNPIPGTRIPSVDYFADTPGPNVATDSRVLNGFATIRLEQDHLTECFYDQGNTTPIWTKKHQV